MQLFRLFQLLQQVDLNKKKKRDALEELNSPIGLEKVKHEIKKMINMVEF